ncbi:MAG TPA: hypothetical protein VIW95_07570, partial [Candidatus Binatus sp.]
MTNPQTHQHENDADDRGVAVDTCPLCGSKISRAEFLEVEAKIRIEVQRQASHEIEKITAQKDREREAAVLAKDAAVRKQLSDEAARNTAEALRKQRDDIEESHRRQLAERDEKREGLEGLACP